MSHNDQLERPSTPPPHYRARSNSLDDAHPKENSRERKKITRGKTVSAFQSPEKLEKKEKKDRGRKPRKADGGSLKQNQQEWEDALSVVEKNELRSPYRRHEKKIPDKQPEIKMDDVQLEDDSGLKALDDELDSWIKEESLADKTPIRKIQKLDRTRSLSVSLQLEDVLLNAEKNKKKVEKWQKEYENREITSSDENKTDIVEKTLQSESSTNGHKLGLLPSMSLTMFIKDAEESQNQQENGNLASDHHISEGNSDEVLFGTENGTTSGQVEINEAKYSSEKEEISSNQAAGSNVGLASETRKKDDWRRKEGKKEKKKSRSKDRDKNLKVHKEKRQSRELEEKELQEDQSKERENIDNIPETSEKPFDSESDHKQSSPLPSPGVQSKGKKSKPLTAQDVLLQLAQKELQKKKDDEHEKETTEQEIRKLEMPQPMQETDPGEMWNILKVDIVNATGLAFKGQRDLFCTVSYDKVKHKSITLHDVEEGKHAVWHETFIFFRQDSTELEIQIWAKKKLGKDDFLGQVTFTPEDMAKIKRAKDLKCKWYSLSKRKEKEIVTGSIQLNVEKTSKKLRRQALRWTEVYKENIDSKSSLEDGPFESSTIENSILQQAANSNPPNLIVIAEQIASNPKSIDTLWCNWQKQTLLHLMSLKGDSKATYTLVKRGAKLSVTDINGMTPLHLAAIAGDKATCEILLENGAELEGKDTGNMKATPLHYACEYGNEEVVAFFLGKNALIEARDSMQATPAIKAARNGHLTCLQLLALNKADLGARDDQGNAALLAAALNGKLEIVEWGILEMNMDVTCTNQEGENLMWSFVKNFNKEWVNRLLGMPNVDLNQQTGIHGMCLLHRVCLYLKGVQAEQALEFLLSKNVNVNVRTKGFQTPLFCASYSGHLGLVQLLVAHGADVNTQDRARNTPLHFAGSPELAKFLLLKGADVNAKNLQGNTPLHAAFVFYDSKVAEILKANGAEDHRKNIHGNTPAEALWCGVHEIKMPCTEAKPEHGGLYITKVTV